MSKVARFSYQSPIGSRGRIDPSSQAINAAKPPPPPPPPRPMPDHAPDMARIAADNANHGTPVVRDAAAELAAELAKASR